MLQVWFQLDRASNLAAESFADLFLSVAPARQEKRNHSCFPRTMPDPPATTRVMVVDDDRSVADTLVAVLNQNGFDASAAYSGREAIERALTIPPDCILMDVFMGEIDGVDAAVAIRETIPGCGILLISGYEDARERMKKGSQRGHDFELLMKPIQPAPLLHRLRTQQVCDGKRAA